MPIKPYGVLSGNVVDTRREDNSDTPHYQIQLVDSDDKHWRAAVNVLSQDAPRQLKFLVDTDFRHPITDALPEPGSGWTNLPNEPGGASLDFVRANLFDPSKMRVLPFGASGPDNDLSSVLDHYIQRAVGDNTITAYVFGQSWGPEHRADKVFGFRPGDGVHQVHMNQGNSEDYSNEDGTWQDGGLLLHLTSESRWVAIFLAFQSQSWHTDDVTGHALPDAPDLPPTGGEQARILAAMVNPVGSAPGAQTVTLINASPTTIDFSGWRIADRRKHTCPISPDSLAPGAILQMPLSNGVSLGNEGGAITLLDAAGLKVHGVAYTADRAQREGWTITF